MQRELALLLTICTSVLVVTGAENTRSIAINIVSCGKKQSYTINTTQIYQHSCITFCKNTKGYFHIIGIKALSCVTLIKAEQTTRSFFHLATLCNLLQTTNYNSINIALLTISICAVIFYRLQVMISRTLDAWFARAVVYSSPSVLEMFVKFCLR